jgi:signal peptidase II
MLYAVRAATIAGVAIPAIFLDQITKAMAQTRLASGEIVELLPVLNLRLGFNRGISFGLAPAEGIAGLWGLIVLTAAIVISLAVWAVRTGDGRERLPLSLILGGAIGNLIDRVRDGMVTDFIDLHAAGYHWPTFNIADIAITAGAGLFVLSSVGLGSRGQQPEPM